MIFVVLIPWIGVLVYLIANHDEMAERRMSEAKASQAQFDEYVREAAGGTGGAAAEIEKAKQLLDSGAITQAEFDAIKAKAVVACPIGLFAASSIEVIRLPGRSWAHAVRRLQRWMAVCLVEWCRGSKRMARTPARSSGLPSRGAISRDKLRRSRLRDGCCSGGRTTDRVLIWQWKGRFRPERRGCRPH